MRPFGQVLHQPGSLPDLRVLAGIAEEMGTGLPQGLGFRTSEQVWAEMGQVGPWDGTRSLVSDPVERDADARHLTELGEESDELVLASWKQMVDDGRMQDGADDLRSTARRPVLLVGEETRERLGARVGDVVTLAGPLGSVDLPLGVADLAPGTVWAPASAPGLSVRHLVGPAGSSVSITTIVGGTR